MKLKTKAEYRAERLKEQLAGKVSPPQPEEHPEDRAYRIEGEKYGREHAAEFCAAHAADFERLIGTYADATAEELLAELRERFWIASCSEMRAPLPEKQQLTEKEGK